jgi:uncharacterized protein YndB with AHSA1/START domain
MNEGWAQTLDRLGSHAATTASESQIITTRVFDAPPDVVFGAWGDANALGQWWGPRGFTTKTHSMDFRPGGHWRYTMHGPDGTDYPNRVTYKAIERPTRIAYSHGDTPEPGANDFQVTAAFEPAGHDGRRTRITIRMAFPSAEAKRLVVERYGAIQGQRETFDRLDRYLATPGDEPGAF